MSVGTTAVLLVVFWAGSGVSSQQIPIKDYKTCMQEKDPRLKELDDDFKSKNDSGWRMVISGTCINQK